MVMGSDKLKVISGKYHERFAPLLLNTCHLALISFNILNFLPSDKGGREIFACTRARIIPLFSLPRLGVLLNLLYNDLMSARTVRACRVVRLLHFQNLS